MVDPDCVNCPQCFTPRLGLKRRPRIKETEEGTKVVGSYYGCEPDCNALTMSPATGQYNLRDEVAQAYGIQRKTEASVQSKIRPIIRKKAA